MAEKARKKRVVWSEEETKAVMDGVKAHGVGSWSKIKNDERFMEVLRSRDSDHIRNRYSTVMKLRGNKTSEGQVDAIEDKLLDLCGRGQ